MAEKYKRTARVISQQRIAGDIYSIYLFSERGWGTVKPGQFLSLYPNDSSKLLPRPISICEADPEAGTLRLVYRVTGANTGTEQFSRLKAGDEIEVLGPLGNGFPLEHDKKTLLIGGGIGIPPLLLLARQLCGQKQIVAGYRDELFLTDALSDHGHLLIATEDGSTGTKGNVMDVIAGFEQKPELIYACGPTPMLRAVKEYAAKHQIRCYLSLEERMACGIGACLGCVCRTMDTDAHSNVKNQRICKDGPVFLASEVEL